MTTNDHERGQDHRRGCPGQSSEPPSAASTLPPFSSAAAAPQMADRQSQRDLFPLPLLFRHADARSGG